MYDHLGRTRQPLEENGTVVVIGGGPAGAFFSIHLLRRARELQRAVRVVVIERRRQGAGQTGAGFVGGWRGCSYCAGGLSPKLNDVLKRLDLRLPEEVIQSRVRSITVQGYWKNIELEVPDGREMLSVFRGVRPAKRLDRQHSLDSLLLARALEEGAVLLGGEVYDAEYSARGRPVVSYRAEGAEARLEADFAVFAGGVNECAETCQDRGSLLPALQRLAPHYRPPRLRPALIFELEAAPGVATYLEGQLHFVEYGSAALRLEMCSLLPKRGYITVVLVGPSVDASTGPADNVKIINEFLQLPHIRKLVPPSMRLRTACACNPRLVVGSARHAFADRVAAVGDMVTSRLYKDGILSAHHTASALAETLLVRGVDRNSLQEGYAPVIQGFRRDNRFAALVFLLHRLVFGSSVLSRVLYQAVITERKRIAASARRLEKILWKIASGDDQYEATFLSMIHPATLWLILSGGLWITLRNYLTERFFNLSWEGFGRFTTGVAKEHFDTKRVAFRRELGEYDATVPDPLEFERMYTIRIRARCAQVLHQLGRFGESDRGYFRPHWVQIQRTEGVPNEPGCLIRYEVLCHRFSFCLQLEQIVQGHLLVYRVRDGFARGGVLLFEVEQDADEICNLSIYVAFQFVRGETPITRLLWLLFRRLFPSFVHDVLWNHSLCQLKNLAEAEEHSSAG
ncbi:MAG: hypothetical protein LAP85_24810 [Acidobacteriia bacterium]|nr:hypothetical protein [Terriglobia bacterium]